MDLEEISLIIDIAEEKMDTAVEHLQNELTKLRTGKASTDLLKGIMVMYYGAPTPLHQVANVSTGDARTLLIQPWERNMLGAIEKALFEAQLGMTPQNDGQVIRLIIPPVTEERRRDLVKKAKHCGEESKVGVRAARHKALDELKKAVKAGLSEDIGKKEEAKVDNLTKSFIEKIDKIVEIKEKEIMTV
ncbi:MAG: ribosome recycling factor [Saprospiraceae bacterium]|nr:ribosome recycling factor [Saprospiraceae bacterium]